MNENKDIYTVSSSKGLMIILGIVSMLLLYGGCTYVYQVVSKGIAGEKIIYIVLFVGIFGLFFGTLWNRLTFKITVTKDRLKIRNMFFKEKEYYFNDITNYKCTKGRWNSNVNVFMEEKKIFSIDSGDNNFNRLYGDIKNEVERKNQGKSSIKENVKEYTIKRKKNDVGSFIVLMLCLYIVMFIVKYMWKGTASENEVNTMFNIAAIFLLIIILWGIRDLSSKMIVRGNTMILIKLPFTKTYCQMSDIERIHYSCEIMDIYIKQYFFLKTCYFSPKRI